MPVGATENTLDDAPGGGPCRTVAKSTTRRKTIDGVTTIRVAQRKRYTVVSRDAVNDSRLSFRARGVLAWLLDKPDDWHVSAEEIANHGGEGRDAIRTALAELELCGYLVRRRFRVQGKWSTEQWLYESRQEPTPDDDAQASTETEGAPETSAENPQRLTSDGKPAPDSQALKTEDCNQKTGTENSLGESGADSPYDGSTDPPTVDAIRQKKAVYPAQFVECWQLYPKHAAGRDHDKQAAYRAWRARVVEAPKAGMTRARRMENLLAAVQGYAVECEDEDRDPQFMKNASTFFGAQDVMAFYARVFRERCGPPHLSVVS